MTRFCQQRDEYSCGPIALLNIDKFFGIRATYADLPYYKRLLHCKYPSGTLTSNMSKILGRASRRSWFNTKKFLHDGESCLVFQHGAGRGERLGHLFIVVMNDNKEYILVNYCKQAKADIKISAKLLFSVWKAAFRLWYVGGNRWLDI